MAKTDSKESAKKMEETSKKRVLSYLENQLKMKREQLKYYEAPLDPETIKDIRKMEELILKNKIWQLEELIEQIKYL